MHIFQYKQAGKAGPANPCCGGYMTQVNIAFHPGTTPLALSTGGVRPGCSSGGGNRLHDIAKSQAKDLSDHLKQE